MKLTPDSIYEKKSKREKITALTAYDFPTARILDEAGVDILVVGDSLGMVLLGHENTCDVTLKDIAHHTRPVARASKRALVVADMPYHSYLNPEEALANAKALVKEHGADAVKLEGGLAIEHQLIKLVGAGIPVMGHIGMLPQAVQNNKYRVHGKSEEEAASILEDAKLLEKLGAFAIVLECLPASLAKKITQSVKCPTIGIGAGAGTDGQILVVHDMLGIRSGVSPRFVRRYADVEETVKEAVRNYCRDVIRGKYPSEKESFH
ncbi:MAG: 3-methyl-2-oxobutanoate hydroxymethyltransferase [Candidatus Omnitrophica bacterium ADurb.Bin277]|nr:MAG: 3-methyl-2-oxobutanoate hydroxymethyltransferase [Candidatus Omnitrophica bacterium ADurb.Bin277]